MEHVKNLVMADRMPITCVVNFLVSLKTHNSSQCIKIKGLKGTMSYACDATNWSPRMTILK
jgi:hypothetical protein